MQQSHALTGGGGIFREVFNIPAPLCEIFHKRRAIPCYDWAKATFGSAGFLCTFRIIETWLYAWES